MPGTRADLVLLGQVVLQATRDGVQTADAIGIADGRVVSAGTRDEVLGVAARGARRLDLGGSAIVPGIHDFHLHLIGMARARRDLVLDGAPSFAAIRDAIALRATGLQAGEWLRGRGWHESVFEAGPTTDLASAVGDAPAFLYSHDGHSAWASPAGLALAGLGDESEDPAGGRLERDPAGRLTGVLRERATDLVEPVCGRLGGDRLRDALDETLAALSGLGITAATDAGDSAAIDGVGAYAALGDRASQVLANHDLVDGRLRLALNVPSDAVAAAAGLGLRTGVRIGSNHTLRGGWVKVYLDGALGSRTAACFDAFTCGRPGNRGILRMQADDLTALLDESSRAGLRVAMHAIGDRALALALEALERVPERVPASATGPAHRLEHLQLVRRADLPRLVGLGLTASLQPIHVAADREPAERCWADRMADVYATRAIAASGARLAFGSDAPIESVNPWHGIFAAVHRRFPADGTPDWRPDQAIGAPAALAAYTSGPAAGLGAIDEGHLHPGARADLAVLDIDLPTLLAGDEAMATARSLLTLVDGREVHRA